MWEGTLGRTAWHPLEANKGVEGSGRKTRPFTPIFWNPDGKQWGRVKVVCVYWWMPTCSVPIKGEKSWNSMKSPGYGGGEVLALLARGGILPEDDGSGKAFW